MNSNVTSSTIMNTYGERALTLVKGEGTTLWDDQGNEYLDALSGIAVTGLGHAHPGLATTLSEQANTLIHVSNLYNIEPQKRLADLLCDQSGMDRVFFSNSGAEANEAALKIARKYGNSKDIKVPTVITANGSFHGRTMATLSATGNPKVQDGFAPLVQGFKHVEYGSIDAVENAADGQTVAIMVEPIQGEGGVNTPPDDYLIKLRELCDKNGWLLILDEIQTGNGRTGKLFAYQHYGILPDIVTTAKGLGNGLPIGACLARGNAAEVLQPGNHGSTYGGNPLVCAGAHTVISTLINDNLIENASQRGEQLIELLKDSFADSDKVVDIRGKGLMVGIQLSGNCSQLVAAAAAKGLLINVTAGNTIRLLPPLIVSEEEIKKIAAIVADIVNTDFEG